MEKHPASVYCDVSIVPEDNFRLGAYLVKPRVVDVSTLFFVVCHRIGSNQYTHASVCGSGEALGGRTSVCCLRVPGSLQAQKESSLSRYMRDTLQADNVHLYAHELGGAIVLEYIRHAHVKNALLVQLAAKHPVRESKGRAYCTQRRRQAGKEHAVRLGVMIGVEPVFLSGTHNCTLRGGLSSLCWAGLYALRLSTKTIHTLFLCL